MKNLIKMIRSFILLSATTLSIFSCGPSQKESDKIQLEKEKSANEKLFYYPIPYDDYWRIYDANIVGAEGWISNKCSQVNIVAEQQDLKPIEYYRNKRIKVLNSYAKHSSWGTYKGSLTVLLLEDSTNVTIEYKDFKPDFEVGDWLSMEYKEK